MPNAYRATKANRVRLARRVMSRTATADANWVVRLIRRRFASAEQRTAKRARNRAGAIPARIAKTAIIPTTAHVFRANKSLATIAKNARRTSVRHVTTDMNPIRTRVNANPKPAPTAIRQASRRAIPAVRLAKAVIPQAIRAANVRRNPVRRSVAMSLKDIRLLRIRADALLVLRKRVRADIRQASHRATAAIR